MNRSEMQQSMFQECTLSQTILRLKHVAMARDEAEQRIMELECNFRSSRRVKDVQRVVVKQNGGVVEDKTISLHE